jgi:hypothetical protein
LWFGKTNILKGLKMSHMSEKQIDEMNRANEQAIQMNAEHSDANWNPHSNLTDHVRGGCSICIAELLHRLRSTAATGGYGQLMMSVDPPLAAELIQKLQEESDEVIAEWRDREVYDLRAENAVLRGCEEILKKRIALLEAKCEFLSRGDAEKYQKTMEEITNGGWRTGSTKQFLGLTEEEVDTIDGWMEEGKNGDKQ